MRYRIVELLDHAVQEILFADNPAAVGVNVSGGLDSSTTLALVKKWYPTVHTFTGYYDAPGFDERPYARMVAAGTRHHEIRITPQDFVGNFAEMMLHFTPPFQGPGMFGQYMVAKHISEAGGVTTVMSGEGSDELFGGYARLIKVAKAPMPDGYENYKPPADYPSNLADALKYDYDRLPDLLKVDDEALAAFGLRAASPFLNDRVTRYALGLPVQMRVAKNHLRAAVRGLVPDPIIDRTDKMGMPVPLIRWANEVGNPVRDFFGDRLGYIPALEDQFSRSWWNELLAPYNEPAYLAA